MNNEYPSPHTGWIGEIADDAYAAVGTRIVRSATVEGVVAAAALIAPNATVTMLDREEAEAVNVIIEDRCPDCGSTLDVAFGCFDCNEVL